MKRTEEEHKFYIISEVKTDETLRIPQVNIDTHGFITTRPDSFVPPVDIVAGESYEIYLDMPGIQKDDIELLRQNVTTVIRGKRKSEFKTDANNVVKQERKFGEFLITFRIPEI